MPRAGAVSCSPLFKEYLNTLMPSYFPEGDEPLPSDSFERLLQKLVSLADIWAGSIPDNEPKPNDASVKLYQKFVKSLTTKIYA
jgi:hypothetical protein